VVSLTSSSGGYINGRNSANLELLIDKTSLLYLYVKLKALASWIFLSFTSFWRNSYSYEYKNKLARRGAQFVLIGMPTTCWNSVPPKETNMLYTILHILSWFHCCGGERGGGFEANCDVFTLPMFHWTITVLQVQLFSVCFITMNSFI
jgi:hypothetical protein